MPESKHSPLLWIGLIGGGVALWWYMKNKGAAGTPLLSPGQSLPSGQPPGQAMNPTQKLPLAVAPTVLVTAAPQPVTTTAPPNGIDPATYATVQKWAQSDGRAPVLTMAAAAVPAEYAGVYDLITNVWDKGLTPDQAQVDFWNNLRDKYDPSHASW